MLRLTTIIKILSKLLVMFKWSVFNMKAAIFSFLSRNWWITKWNSSHNFYPLVPLYFVSDENVGRNKWDQKIKSFNIGFFWYKCFFEHQTKAAWWFLGLNKNQCDLGGALKHFFRLILKYPFLLSHNYFPRCTNKLSSTYECDFIWK